MKSVMEIFKDITETDGKYSVSNLGNIKRNHSETIDKWNRKRITNEKILKPCLVGKGYFEVTLRVNKENIKRYVHRLVAIEFIPNVNQLPEVNHKDFDKLNNCIDNLEYVTNRENTNHRFQFENKSSKLQGVTWNKKKQKWQSQKMIQGKRTYLGLFETETEAHQKYLSVSE